ncbi:conjugal transfer protein TraX [Tissierella sp. MSJ-40]|uniref:Conjugal transfer protein TraX n=1 Tax=Tissierella simiarum TaxID=2841534 RepID=A0ABS6E4S5_9FIRM|nr:TraX family protein [Tissierella simiarum]MBU5437912.1 conjugal transfer protein TraX [Tissierella simiarum]
MLIGNFLVSFTFRRDYFVTNNIFLSMAMGIALLIAIDNLNNREGRNKVKNILLIFIICLISLFTEGSFIGTAMVLIFFYFKKDKIKMSIAYILLSSIFLTGGFTYNNLFVLNPQWMMVFSLPFMLMYNGKRGFNLKYFFYIFYPLHIWILYIMGYFIELRY